MSYISKSISQILKEYVNKTTYLPAIQREYVWETDRIEKLFDSIMSDYPIGTFLFWKVPNDKKPVWKTYKFIEDFDENNPHNNDTTLDGNRDFFLVLDGQQRLTSLLIGLKGTYTTYSKNKKKKCVKKLYLNLLKDRSVNGLNSDIDELDYQFEFRENDESDVENLQLWYEVRGLLNYDDAEAVKEALKQRYDILNLDDNQKGNANYLIGQLFARIHTKLGFTYYEETTQNEEKVVEVFVRANTGGVKLEFSDILLSTATAQWKRLDARETIHLFTDEINKIGSFEFDKDFVLKGCLYLTDLPIQYKLKNFNKTNLECIENKWESISTNLKDAIQLVQKFGFSKKNLTAKNAVLPIALYLSKINKKNFVDSSDKSDEQNKNSIKKWLIIALLRGIFAGSTDTVLSKLREVIKKPDSDNFPLGNLNDALSIQPFNDQEIEELLKTEYNTKYSYLILSLLYLDWDWQDKAFHEDHIFPKNDFKEPQLKQKYDDDVVKQYKNYFNCISNLELLTQSENSTKLAKQFADWIKGRDDNFKDRHLIPKDISYNFSDFIEFIEKRNELLTNKLKETLS